MEKHSSHFLLVCSGMGIKEYNELREDVLAQYSKMVGITPPVFIRLPTEIDKPSIEVIWVNTTNSLNP